MPANNPFEEIVVDLENVLKLHTLISALLERFYSNGQSFIFSAPPGSDFSQLQISFSALSNAEIPQAFRALVIGVTIGGSIKFFGFLDNGNETLRLNNYPEFREDLDNWISEQALKTYSEVTLSNLPKPKVEESEQAIYNTLHTEVKKIFETKIRENVFILRTAREKLIMLCFRDSNGSPIYVAAFSIALGGLPVFRNTSYQFYYKVTPPGESEINGVRFVGDLSPKSFLEAIEAYNKGIEPYSDANDGDALVPEM